MHLQHSHQICNIRVQSQRRREEHAELTPTAAQPHLSVQTLRFSAVTIVPHNLNSSNFIREVNGSDCAVPPAAGVAESQTHKPSAMKSVKKSQEISL